MTRELGRLEKAIIFATKAFNGQLDKVGVPSIFHSMDVMRLQTYLPESYMVVAILHDILEDTPLKMEDILEEVDLSPDEQEALELLTHRNNEPYRDYIQNIKDSYNSLAICIKVADYINNKRRKKDGLSPETIERLNKKYKIVEEILLSETCPCT